MKTIPFTLYFHPLNFIRFVLAVGVLLFHYGLNYYPFNLPILETLITNSSFRVSFFFFISGFVMSLVYGRGNEQTDAVHFYKKRMTRILPVYWLAFVFTLLAVFLLKGSSPKGLVIALHFLGLQSWYPGYVLDLNFTTWSISVELVFYAVFPFLLKWVMKQRTGRLLALTLLVWVLQSVQHIWFINSLSDGSKVMEEFINAFPLWHLITFFVGVTSARLISLDFVSKQFRKLSVFVLLVILAVFFFLIYVPNPILKYIHNGLLAPLFAIFVLALYYDTSLIHRILSLNALSKLGDLSYGIFIFQYPVWVLCEKVADNEFKTQTSFFFLYFFTVLMVSYLVNRFFEKPLLRRLRNTK